MALDLAVNDSFWVVAVDPLGNNLMLPKPPDLQNLLNMLRRISTSYSYIKHQTIRMIQQKDCNSSCMSISHRIP